MSTDATPAASRAEEKAQIAEQRIKDTIEAILREEMDAFNARDWDNWEERFFDPHFSAKLPHPMPPVFSGADAWVNFYKMLCQERPDCHATAVDFNTIVNDRRDKAECYANWEFSGLHPGISVKVLGFWTFRKANGKWRIWTYEGWDNMSMT